MQMTGVEFGCPRRWEAGSQVVAEGLSQVVVNYSRLSSGCDLHYSASTDDDVGLTLVSPWSRLLFSSSLSSLPACLSLGVKSG